MHFLRDNFLAGPGLASDAGPADPMAQLAAPSSGSHASEGQRTGCPRASDPLRRARARSGTAPLAATWLSPTAGLNQIDVTDADMPHARTGIVGGVNLQMVRQHHRHRPNRRSCCRALFDGRPRLVSGWSKIVRRDPRGSGNSDPNAPGIALNADQASAASTTQEPRAALQAQGEWLSAGSVADVATQPRPPS